MKQVLLLVFALVIAELSNAQDTTWVQTFTFDSISSRRADFEFPTELNGKRFEKVLMYYKLKCSPLTPWDSYNCGEWDYLTYTQVHEHTGEMDSVEVKGKRFKVNGDTLASYTYNANPFFDTYETYHYSRPQTTIDDHAVISGGTESIAIMNTENRGSRIQFLVTAGELLTGGVVAGDITSLALDLSQVGEDASNMKIALKSTSDLSLGSYHTSGFEQVYGQHLTGAIVGVNDFIFSAPFNWDGTSNVIVEVTFENIQDGTTNYIANASEQLGVDYSVSYPAKNGCLVTTFNDYAELDMTNEDIGGDFTVSFWSKGNGSAGQNTSVLEAFDSLGNRVINLHFPWSDNVVYWDAGEGSGYDRISKSISPSIIDNAWHHWSFVKKTSTGEMMIYLDGTLWHSGTGLTRNVGKIAKFVLGSSVTNDYQYQGKLDEFQIFTTAIEPSDIAAWKDKQLDPSHPNYSDLVVYYDFDDEQVILDRSGNNRLGMPSTYGMLQFDEMPLAGKQVSGLRPNITFGQGVLGDLDSTLANVYVLREPQVIFEYAATDNAFDIINSTIAYPGAVTNVYDYQGNLSNSFLLPQDQSIQNETINYFKEPFEIINNVEIARYITPYGINFDLGPNGFSWIVDVSDYQQYLKNIVDLSAHNTQELLDLKFAFIEGIPPRDVHNREPIWADFKSYSFTNLSTDISLPAKTIALADTSEMFKIKTRFTGHGHEGNANCCEWVPNDHKIAIDGVNRFSWNIWQPNECADNPLIGQGGTWPYAREGWCPGDVVPEYEHELTPYVAGGSNVSIDYQINDIPTNDPGQGSGNYVAALDLISYSAPNFQNDAAIVEVLNPNNYEYFRKWNPTCSNPRIVLKNTGEQALTSCKIRCWISYGDWLEYEWTGNLAFLEEEIVEIPVTNTSWWADYNGTMSFTAQVYAVNAEEDLDEYANNNVKSVNFEAPEFIDGPFYAWFKTNNKASENKYKLIDQNGNVIFERTSLTNSTEYKDTFDLDAGCYSIIVEDSDDDGLGFWYSNQVEGESYGSFRIRKVGGGAIETFPTDFGGYHKYDFSIGFGLGLETSYLDHEILVYPNPNDGIFKVELSGFVGDEAVIDIVDMLGKNIYHGTMQADDYFASIELNIPTMESGTYFVKVTTNERVYIKEMVKQ